MIKNIEEFIKADVIKPFILGADECGYGAWCGEIVVCGVRASKDWHLDGINDSKKIAKKKRYKLRDDLIQSILRGDISFHMAERSSEVIDQIGVAKALKDCYVEIFHSLYQPDTLIVCDGTLKFDDQSVNGYDQISMIKADGKISAVMAASILGKTYRDTKMELYDAQYPGYDWKNNVGYGAATHRNGIDKLGLTPLHRMSYAPMKHMRD